MYSIWHASLVVPAYLSAASAVILILHIVVRSKPIKTLYTRLIPNSHTTGSRSSTPDPGQGIHPASFFGQVKEHMSTHGGWVIFAYKVSRLVGCLVLLGLSLATLILEERGHISEIVFGISSKHWGKRHRKHRHSKDSEFSDAEWLQVALCATTVCPPCAPQLL